MNRRLHIGLLLTISLLVYCNTLTNRFTFDDEFYIQQNPAVTTSSLKAFFQPNRENNVLRPVTSASFALNWAIAGAQPFGYHLVNLILHTVAVLLLYLLLATLLDSIPHNEIIAFSAALLFAVHPIHTEAVAWVTGRSELLAACFLLGAWLLHIQDRPVLSLVCFLFSLMSKESAVVFLPLILAGDYARSKFKPLYRYAAVFAASFLYMAAFWKLEGGTFGEKSITFLDNPLSAVPAPLRILNACRIAWKYLALLVYPARLSCDYSYNAIVLYSNWRYLAPAALGILAILAVWIWTFRTRLNPWFLAGAIYLVGFSVTSNVLTPTGTIMGERLAYLPSAGFCLLLALIWTRLENVQRTVAWVCLVLVASAFFTRTVIRNRDWRDNFALYSAAVKVVPGSAKMHANLGVQYGNRGQLDAAKSQYQISLSIYPDYSPALESYGLLQARLGQDEEATKNLGAALALTPRESMNYDFNAVNLAALLVKRQQNDKAVRLLNDLIAKSPGNARAWSNRAAAHYQAGAFVAARSDAQTAVGLDPANLQARQLLTALDARSTETSIQ